MAYRMEVRVVAEVKVDVPMQRTEILRCLKRYIARDAYPLLSPASG